jgi:hypothetical protein
MLSGRVAPACVSPIAIGFLVLAATVWFILTARPGHQVQ